MKDTEKRNAKKRTAEMEIPVLVNASSPIERYPGEEDLAPVMDSFPDVLMERTAAEALKALLEEIGSGDRIVPVSGWRSHREQQKIWDDTIAEKGELFTRKYVAVPGCSEHETGLAIDLAENAPEIDFICPEFPRTGICGKFRERAPHYGFIERYPKGKESVTGIGAEPWHFRYVGLPHSLIMTGLGLVLEEYVGLITENTKTAGQKDGGKQSA